MGLSPLFNIGNSALFASQSAISVTGNNIANVNTPGYSRQYVRLEDAVAQNSRPGMLGQGVNAAEISRRYNRFLEESFLDKYTDHMRWSEQTSVMGSVESLFNEANRKGINSELTNFFKNWQDLSQRPGDLPTRVALSSQADGLAQLFRKSQQDLAALKTEMDMSITTQVDNVNALVEKIASLNKDINANTIKGSVNPNQLYDQRDMAVRDLAALVDIDVIDRGYGDYAVSTKSGHVLVDGTEKFSIQSMGPRAESNLKPGSTYQGDVEFAGTDGAEYTMEIVKGGDAADLDSPRFRVSLDGGKTWLKNDNGTDMTYPITDTDPTTPGTNTVRVKNLDISFSSTENFSAGDRFTVTPKDGLYWVSPTRPPVNITPQTFGDGVENTDRLTGGALTAYYTVRDYNIGRYEDQLNALSETLIWEVNRLHSQGTGLNKQSGTLGNYVVNDPNVPLGRADSGLPFYNKLTEGNLTFSFFNQKTGEHISTDSLDFGGGANFDPNVHTMQDVVNAINTSYAGPPPLMTASVEAGRLQLSAGPDVTFATGNDTSGLLAGLGVNTFFQGSNATDIAVRAEIRLDPSSIATGRVNGNHEVNSGDNVTASAIADLAKKAVRISTWSTTTNLSLTEYHSSLVATVGSDVRNGKFNADYNAALASDLNDRVASLSGVNLDEEMANLIKFQHSYTAAAKMITTADQMLQTILGLKQ